MSTSPTDPTDSEIAAINDLGARQFALDAAIRLGVTHEEWQLAANKTSGDIVTENAAKFHAFLTGGAS